MKSNAGLHLFSLFLLVLLGFSPGGRGSLAQTPGSAASERLLASRALFRSAYPLAQEGQPEPAGVDAGLRDYPLYPYLLAARLQRQLDVAPADASDALTVQKDDFLHDHADLPVTRDLQRHWQRALVRWRHWQDFLDAAAAKPELPEGELRCDDLVARIGLLETTPAVASSVASPHADLVAQRRALTEAATRFWLTGEETPAACQPAFDWLRSQGVLNRGLERRRAVLALEAGHVALARRVASPLDGSLAQWVGLIEHPQQELPPLIDHPLQPVDPAALRAGWFRYALREPDEALQRYPQLIAGRHITGSNVVPYARAMGLALAWNRRPGALAWLNRVPSSRADDRVRDWRLRAAVWANDWPTVTEILKRPLIAGEPDERAQFWRARAAEGEGNAAAAQAGYVALAAGNGYYPALAAARLGQPFTPHGENLVFDAESAAELSTLPALIRAHELFLCGLNNEATREWMAGLARVEPALRTQAIGLAFAWGWYDQGVTTASERGIYSDYALLYPRPYAALVEDAAARMQVAPNLIYAIMRQESLYRANVVSAADAYGLLQLIPDTADRAARRWKLPVPRPVSMLFDPSTNIPLGAAELHDLLASFDDQLPLAIAAYNAGPVAVRRWVPTAPRDLDVWIENIPYAETRKYVQRVLWHRLVFNWVNDGNAQSTVLWRTPVTPLTGGAATATAAPGTVGADTPVPAPGAPPAAVPAMAP